MSHERAVVAHASLLDEAMSRAKVRAPACMYAARSKIRVECFFETVRFSIPT